jgi:hypothetical protein
VHHGPVLGARVQHRLVHDLAYFALVRSLCAPLMRGACMASVRHE